MSRVSRRAGVLAVLVVLLVTSCADGSASAGAGSDGAPPINRWPGVRLAHAVADVGCTHASYDTRVWLIWSDPLGEELGQDLVVCTTPDHDAVWINNASTSVLWTVDAPAYNYWWPSHDADEPLTVQIFREVARTINGGVGPVGRLTVEPGTFATLGTAPDRLHVSVYLDQQALWSSTTLVVTQVYTRAEESLFRVLRAGSRTRGVVVACAIDGYRAGQDLAEAEGDPSETLAAGLGLARNAASSRCASEVRQLEDELRKPRLTLSKLQNAAKPTSSWASQVDNPLLAAARRVAAALPR